MEIHGGNIYKIKRENGKEVLDYSSNINPLGIPKSFRNALFENLDNLVRYPDVDYVELKEKIAKFNGCKAENIVVGNGATEVLFLYMKNIDVKNIMIISPTFAEYQRGAEVAKKNIEFFPFEKDFSLDIKKLKEASKNIELIVLCNPNNPTGKFQNLGKIGELVEYLEKSGKKLFIDESFIEFIDGWREKTAVNLKNKNIFILRALTKYFAIPGVRLGYGISFDKLLLKRIEENREPWSVNGVAEIAGKVMLEDREYIEKTDSWIKKEKKLFFEELSKFRDIDIVKSEVNFILLKLKTMNSKEFKNKMLEHNVLVRDCSNFKYLDNSYVRIAIKDRKTNSIFIEKLKKVIK